MKILMVNPGKAPYEAELENSLEAMQKAVGGYIQAIYPYKDPVALVTNEEGKLEGLPLNRALYDEKGEIYDIIAGNFFIAGLGRENLTDLPADLMKKYRRQFWHPELFFRINGKIRAIQLPEKAV